MSAGHHHTVRPTAEAVASAGQRHKRRLAIALGILAGFTVIEVAAAWWTGSLALLSDGAHLFTDALGIGMALAAIHVASRSPIGSQRTFGLYRLEVLAALGNAILLFAAAGYVLIEALRRFSDPPTVQSTPMLLVALAGMVANLVAFALLRPGAAESVNVRGAYLEVLADTVGSVGVIVAALVIEFTDWWYADPLVALGVAGFVLPRTVKLAAAAIRILVQAAPAHLDVAQIERELRAVPGVTDVHDLHVWTLTSGMDVASAHLTISPQTSLASVLAAARSALQERYGIEHATLQIEPAGAPEACCRSVGW